MDEYLAAAEGYPNEDPNPEPPNIFQSTRMPPTREQSHLHPHLRRNLTFASTNSIRISYTPRHSKETNHHPCPMTQSHIYYGKERRERASERWRWADLDGLDRNRGSIIHLFFTEIKDTSKCQIFNLMLVTGHSLVHACSTAHLCTRMRFLEAETNEAVLAYVQDHAAPR